VKQVLLFVEGKNVIPFNRQGLFRILMLLIIGKLNDWLSSAAGEFLYVMVK
jgi:hypothetical protein